MTVARSNITSYVITFGFGAPRSNQVCRGTGNALEMIGLPPRRLRPLPLSRRIYRLTEWVKRNLRHHLERTQPRWRTSTAVTTTIHGDEGFTFEVNESEVIVKDSLREPQFSVEKA